MQRTNRPMMILGIAIAAGGLLVAVVFALSSPSDKAKSWSPVVEGFLAVPTPCCDEASLWDALDEVASDGQRPRPASPAEAARWVNDWPYRSRDDKETPNQEELRTAAQNSEVRCVGPSTGPGVPPPRDDEETLEAIRYRPECNYSKWRVWTAATAEGRPNERHTVWADEDGFFHGRVDYWK